MHECENCYQVCDGDDLWSVMPLDHVCINPECELSTALDTETDAEEITPAD